MDEARKGITTYPDNERFALQAYAVRRHDAGVVFDLFGLVGDKPDPDNPDDRALMVVGMTWPRLKEFAALAVYLVGQRETDVGVIATAPRRPAVDDLQVH